MAKINSKEYNVVITDTVTERMAQLSLNRDDIVDMIQRNSDEISSAEPGDELLIMSSVAIVCAVTEDEIIVQQIIKSENVF